jgi:hypothetical protein
MRNSNTSNTSTDPTQRSPNLKLELQRPWTVPEELIITPVTFIPPVIATFPKLTKHQLDLWSLHNLQKVYEFLKMLEIQ